MFFRKIEGMICNKWNLLMTVCFAFFVYAWTDKDDEVIFRILGGIPDYGGRTIEIVPLGKWLFLFGFFFLIAFRTINMSLNSVENVSPLILCSDKMHDF